MLLLLLQFLYTFSDIFWHRFVNFLKSVTVSGALCNRPSEEKLLVTMDFKLISHLGLSNPSRCDSASTRLYFVSRVDRVPTRRRGAAGMLGTGLGIGQGRWTVWRSDAVWPMT